MRVHSRYELSPTWGAARGSRAVASPGLPADPSRVGPAFDRQKRAGEQERRRSDRRRSSSDEETDGDGTHDPRTHLASTLAALDFEAPVETQMSCRHVTAAYTDDD